MPDMYPKPMERKGAAYRITQTRPSHEADDAAHHTHGGSHPIASVASKAPGKGTLSERSNAFMAGLTGI